MHLLVEGEMERGISPAIMQKRRATIRVGVRQPSAGGKSKGIGKLACNLEAMPDDIEDNANTDDCIAVQHDTDKHTRTDRQRYRRIADVCRERDILLLIADDAIEAWLLAAAGLCAWLGQKPKKL